MGFPIAGDLKYGNKEFNGTCRALGLKRMFLHANQVTFTHPLTDEKMRIQAPLPPKLYAILGPLDIDVGALRSFDFLTCD